MAFMSAFAWAQEAAPAAAVPEGAASAPQSAATLPTVTVQDSATSPAPIEDWRSMERTTDTDLKEVLADQVGVQFGGGRGVSQH